MKCISCEANIPPEWVAALQSGICPGCGGNIYSKEHKELMDELRVALSEMKSADAESISGWILSNYKLEKIGEIKPTKFHRMKSTQPNNIAQQSTNNTTTIDNEDTEDAIVTTVTVTRPPGASGNYKPKPIRRVADDGSKVDIGVDDGRMDKLQSIVNEINGSSNNIVATSNNEKLNELAEIDKYNIEQVFNNFVLDNMNTSSTNISSEMLEKLRQQRNRQK